MMLRCHSFRRARGQMAQMSCNQNPASRLTCRLLLQPTSSQSAFLIVNQAPFIACMRLHEHYGARLVDKIQSSGVNCLHLCMWGIEYNH